MYARTLPQPSATVPSVLIVHRIFLLLSITLSPSSEFHWSVASGALSISTRPARTEALSASSAIDMPAKLGGALAAAIASLTRSSCETRLPATEAAAAAGAAYVAGAAAAAYAAAAAAAADMTGVTVAAGVTGAAGAAAVAGAAATAGCFLAIPSDGGAAALLAL
eukprot:scaffold25241_cov63-Phaeocystis_antarctica.AAC.3